MKARTLFLSFHFRFHTSQSRRKESRKEEAMKNSFLLLLSLFTLLFPACDDGGKKTANHYPEPFPMAAQDPLRNVDLVFVVDTSMSMLDEQAKLIANFPLFIDRLKAIHGGMPNLHLGVITPDLGSAPYNIPSCENGGDEGLFKKGADNQCANPAHHYIVDVEPAGCSIEKVLVGNETRCVSHDCTQDNCSRDAFADGSGGFTEPSGLVLAEDEQGCPRCRNYQEETLAEVFSCIANVGAGGCGMEQPLEALMRALTTPAPQNQGFLRRDAYLGVVLLTDEDDCSAENTDLFNPENNSALGALTSFRCTEFGVVCDEPWNRNPQGTELYHNCVSRPDSDPQRMLYPIGRYTAFLSAIKDASRIIASMVAGPYNGTLLVEPDTNMNPQLADTCSTNASQPAVRLQEFVDYFLPSPNDASWARTSICDDDISPALTGISTRLAAMVGTQCLAAVPAGCPDPAAAFGEPPLTALSANEASICQPECTVTLYGADGAQTTVQPCPADYAGGHPAAEDPQLPVENCWHLQYNANCAVPCPKGSETQGCNPDSNPWNYPSRGAQIVVSRRNAASFVRVDAVCSSYHLTETECSDGMDNDADGRVDSQDPDCI